MKRLPGHRGSLVDGVLDEGRKIGRNATGLFPVERVSGAGVHDEARIHDRPCERLLIASRNDRILIAPDDQGGGLDPVELSERIVLQKAFERRSPHPRWDLQVLLCHSLEE